MLDRCARSLRRPPGGRKRPTGAFGTFVRVAPVPDGATLAHVRIVTCTLGGLVGAWAALVVLGRRSGSTRAERAVRLPGDDLVPRPQIVTDHAIGVAATPEEVWPWLTQMGWHLGGWYTPRWVDRLLFPGNWPSLDRLDPDLAGHLDVGDVVPDGAPGTAWYLVAVADPAETLVLHSTTHVPPGWRERFGAQIDWTWTFRLRPTTSGGTRLHLRVRARTAPWWLTLGYRALVVPADHVMAGGMLRGIRERAEGRAVAA